VVYRPVVYVRSRLTPLQLSVDSPRFIVVEDGESDEASSVPDFRAYLRRPLRTVHFGPPGVCPTQRPVRT